MSKTREELIDILWAKAEPTVFVEKDQFVRALDDWKIYGLYRDGVLAVIHMDKGPELHFETMHSGVSFTRDDVAAVVQHLIDEFGYAVTKTPKQEMRQRRFNELVGFRMVGEDEYDIHYRIDQIRGYRRGSQCQSFQSSPQ